MNRIEYMERLDQLLWVMPREEREEALQYYNDYFDDAGVENEERIILELGSPEEVAAKIRAGYAGDSGEYSEQGFEDVRFHSRQDMVAEAERVEGTWESIPKEEIQTGSKKTRQRNVNVWKIIALALITLLAAPIVVPLGIAALAVVFAIVVAILAVLVGVGVSGFAILFAGIVVIVAGIVKVVMAPATGILAAGIGCILLAVGILLSWGIISVLVKVVPVLIRGVVKLLQAPFRKAGAKS